MATAQRTRTVSAMSHPSPTDAGWFIRPAPAAGPTTASSADLIGLFAGASCGTTPGAARAGSSAPGGEQFVAQRVRARATLLHEGATAEALYVVQAGSFKRTMTAEDGYEHVLGFAARGDVLGYDGLADARYAFAAVALEDSRVIALPLAGLGAMRRREPALDAALQAQVSHELAHVGEIAHVMAAVAADARLARFLLQLSARMARRGESPRRLLLHMNRRDIASHLGLAHETISRSFRALADAGCLRVRNREVEIVDADGLMRCARSTRGAAEEAAFARMQASIACAARPQRPGLARAQEAQAAGA